MLTNVKKAQCLIVIAVRGYVYLCNKDVTSGTTDVIASSPDKVRGSTESFPTIHLALYCLERQIKGTRCRNCEPLDLLKFS